MCWGSFQSVSTVLLKLQSYSTYIVSFSQDIGSRLSHIMAVQFDAHSNARVHWTDKDKERMHVSDITSRELAISQVSIVVNKAKFRAR